MSTYLDMYLYLRREGSRPSLLATVKLYLEVGRYIMFVLRQPPSLGALNMPLF